MNEYIIGIKTKQDIKNLAFARHLLYSWYENEEAKMRPEFFGSGEPIRHAFKDKGVEGAIEMWRKNNMPIMLRRASTPRFSVAMSGDFQTLEFPNKCNIWLNKKAKDDIAQKMMYFLIEHFSPAYGFISTYEHEKRKHFVKYKSKRYVGATEERFVGTQIDATFPSIYWLTYFNNDMVEKIGRKLFDTLTECDIFHYDNGVLIKAYGKCFDENIDAENRIINHLGKEKFFDKSEFVKENELELV